MKYAVLIHLLEWKHSKPEFVINEQITFVSLEKHPAGPLYSQLCIKSGIDDGEPFTFRTAFILSETDKDDFSIYPSAEHWSLSSEVLNLLAIIYAGTFGHCRIITSKDNFKTSLNTFELYQSVSEVAYFDLQSTKRTIDTNDLLLLQKLINNLIASATSSNQRINNALTYFYLAWNIHIFEQSAIELSIVIETLFSPGSNTEITHQVSYNLSKFYSDNKKERQENYRMIKKYYSIRSKIVHGEKINSQEHDSIPLLFKFISSVLLRILTDDKLIKIFNDNNLRKEFLNNLLFD